MLQRAPVLEIRRNAGRPKRVAAGGIGEDGSLGATLDHVQHIESRHPSVAESVALAYGAEQWTFFVPGDSGRYGPDGDQANLREGPDSILSDNADVSPTDRGLPALWPSGPITLARTVQADKSL
jgi:hypothetical protein